MRAAAAAAVQATSELQQEKEMLNQQVGGCGGWGWGRSWSCVHLRTRLPGHAVSRKLLGLLVTLPWALSVAGSSVHQVFAWLLA